jgi:CheY-like chemotaxis protein
MLPMQFSLNGLQVLLIEDDLLTLEVFEFTLTHAGALVKCCTSAAQARAVIRSWIPHVIVSDIGLPDEDGLSLIQEFRRLPETAKVPGIALTGYTSKKDQEELLQAGFQRVLAKPIDPMILVECVRNVSTE